MSRFLIELLGAVIAVGGGFYWGYKKCKRDNHIR